MVHEINQVRCRFYVPYLPSVPVPVITGSSMVRSTGSDACVVTVCRLWVVDSPVVRQTVDYTSVDNDLLTTGTEIYLTFPLLFTFAEEFCIGSHDPVASWHSSEEVRHSVCGLNEAIT